MRKKYLIIDLICQNPKKVHYINLQQIRRDESTMERKINYFMIHLVINDFVGYQ